MEGPTRHISADAAAASTGREIGVSEWFTIDQPTVDAFATLTQDTYFIHVDPARAARETPFGGTIAHGYFTLALHPRLAAQVVRFEGFAFAVNYGLNRVRFPAPLPVGKKVRMHATLSGLDDIPGGAQMTVTVTFEVEGGDKPVCVAETIARVYTAG
jgi:acyl dehydratase